MTINGECLHEEQIQSQSRKIEALEVRADYKDKRIDELNDKIEKMDKKLDKLNENINQLILESNNDDKEIELRLTKIETDIENQKRESERKTVWIGIGLTILTILINLYFNMIR